MNLLQLAKKAIENKESWTIGKIVVIFESSKGKVNLKLTQHGKIIMFVSGKARNINHDLGYLSHPTYNNLTYQRWAKAVRKVM